MVSAAEKSIIKNCVLGGFYLGSVGGAYHSGIQVGQQLPTRPLRNSYDPRYEYLHPSSFTIPLYLSPEIVVGTLNGALIGTLTGLVAAAIVIIASRSLHTQETGVATPHKA